MKVALLGSTGQLGRELAPALATFADVRCIDRAELDLGACDDDTVRAVVRGADVVVNAAAYTCVDAAEGDERTAMRVNALGVRTLARNCARERAALLHYSTDFVFDGRGDRPYREDDATNPLSAYGRSKLAGERAVLESGAAALVLRTAWVFGVGARSFVSTILNLARTREELRVVADQVGSPTFARDLAAATAQILQRVRGDVLGALRSGEGSTGLGTGGAPASVVHLAGGGAVSRYELARATLELDPHRASHRVERVVPVPSSEHPLPAPRPAYAPLDCRSAHERFGVTLPPWRDGLARFLRFAST
jgi:dTDP-4-dehydrorhamnose reductase